LRLVHGLLAAVVAAQISYPLVEGVVRARLVVVIVILGYAVSLTHAGRMRGGRAAGALVLVTTGGGFVVEAIGVNACVPFGCYEYSSALGPRPLGVAWVIPLAWTWMAWPAWLAAGRLARRRTARVLTAGLGLAAWDLFLDPQMVAEGYWTWSDPSPTLPGVPDVPISNYVGWFAVAVAMMAVLARVSALNRTGDDSAPLALYLWTYVSSVVAHAAFLGLPGSAAWGGVVMGLVAVPLGIMLWRTRS
jgi:uncharacterized membrane protein